MMSYGFRAAQTPSPLWRHQCNCPAHGEITENSDTFRRSTVRQREKLVRSTPAECAGARDCGAQRRRTDSGMHRWALRGWSDVIFTGTTGALTAVHGELAADRAATAASKLTPWHHSNPATDGAHRECGCRGRPRVSGACLLSPHRTRRRRSLRVIFECVGDCR